MIGKFSIGNITVTSVLRHRFEKERDSFDNYSMWREWKLGFWFKKYKAVGRKDFKNPSKWSSNIVGCYMFGVDLLILKMWIDIDFGSMKLKI